MLFEEETFWLSQKKMGELFNVNVKTISEHLQNIFITNELESDSVIRNFRTTAADGKKYNTQFYNLDAIIAVGYRVNSMEATRFRIWATKTLREMISAYRKNDGNPNPTIGCIVLTNPIFFDRQDWIRVFGPKLNWY